MQTLKRPDIDFPLKDFWNYIEDRYNLLKSDFEEGLYPFGGIVRDFYQGDLETDFNVLVLDKNKTVNFEKKLKKEGWFVEKSKSSKYYYSYSLFLLKTWVKGDKKIQLVFAVELPLTTVDHVANSLAVCPESGLFFWAYGQHPKHHFFSDLGLERYEEALEYSWKHKILIYNFLSSSIRAYPTSLIKKFERLERKGWRINKLNLLKQICYYNKSVQLEIFKNFPSSWYRSILIPALTASPQEVRGAAKVLLSDTNFPEEMEFKSEIFFLMGQIWLDQQQRTLQ